MQENTTLGRRIQEGRKAVGLSQEALGEKLSVSRQAVSKWEADAAIPELENLIAMSRLFGVPVGVLLGVEEPAGRRELTETEQSAVEAIAAKYAAQDPKAGLRRWRWLVPAGAALLAVLLCAQLFRQMDRMDQRITALQDQVSGIQSNVSAQISSAVSRINSAAEETSQLLLDGDVRVTDFDPVEQTVTLRVAARPKERQSDTTAVFTATLEERQFTAEAALQGDSFVAEDWVLPMNSSIDISVMLTDAAGIRTCAVEWMNHCGPEDFRLDVQGIWESDVTRTRNPLKVTLRQLDLSIGQQNPWVELKPVAVDLCLFRNGGTEPEQVIPVEEAVELWNEVGQVWMKSHTGYEASFVLDQPGEQMVAAIRVTDDKGQTFYYVTGAWATDENVASTRAGVDWDRWVPGTP